MTGIPPTIPQDTTQPHTPAHEWASKTTSMLDPDTTNTASSMNPTTKDMLELEHPPPAQATLSGSSAASTPGFPGAYHEDREEKSVQDAAQSVGETAAQYLPKSVVDTVAGYMPARPPPGTIRASEHDVPHQKSLPSTELTGQGSHEHVAGVGALPGSISEVSVARLPDDRSQTATPIPTRPQPASVRASTHDVPHQKSLPSTELTGQGSREHVAGVGSLPGNVSETSVARLPDDRSQTVTPTPGGTLGGVGAGAGLGAAAATFATKTKTFAPSPLGAGAKKEKEAELPTTEEPSISRQAGVGSLPGGKDESGVAKLPEEKASSATPAAAEEPTTTSPAEEPTATLPAEEKTQVPAETQKAEGLSAEKETQLGGSGAVGASAVGATREEEKVGGQHGKPNQDGHEPLEMHDDESDRRETRDRHHHQHSRPHSPASCASSQGLVADQHHPTLEPRKHALGSGGATWFGVKVDVEGARAEEPSQLEERDGGVGEGLERDGDGTGYQTDYHPAELHPPGEQPTTTSATEETRAEQAKKEGPSEKAHEMPKHEEPAPVSPGKHEKHEGEGKKKIGFMEKMKGEAKVLFGRVEGKKGEAMVEEGKKILAGEKLEKVKSA
ncbi:unnamed protein product [Somion occarium]|uniref:Proteophosphoglycan ppg4 n=1 Tax=Somion occarium TaxID=3059160 RepID=A0ABP1CTZ9_9APHY